jgi:hypothetical protein
MQAPQQQVQQSADVEMKVKKAWNHTAHGYVATHCSDAIAERPMFRIHRLAAQVYDAFFHSAFVC